MNQLASDTEDANWVEVIGVVRYAGMSGGQLVLEVAAEGKRVRVLFGDGSPPPGDWRDWVDAEVRVQAVCGVVSGRNADGVFLDLHAPKFTNLVVEVKAPKVPDELPVRTVAGFPPGRETHPGASGAGARDLGECAGWNPMDPRWHRRRQSAHEPTPDFRLEPAGRSVRVPRD